MEAKEKKEPSALEIAYKVVMGLGYTHSQLVKKFQKYRVNYPTLRRIRDGKPVKQYTAEYYQSLFVDLVNKKYEQCVRMGGEGDNDLLRKMRLILLAMTSSEKMTGVCFTNYFTAHGIALTLHRT